MRQQQQRPPKMIVRRDGSIDWKGSWLEGHRYYDHRHRHHHHHHHRRRRRRRREERGGTMMGMSSLVGMMMIGGGGGGRGKKKGNGGKGGDDDDVPFFVEYRPDLTADEDEEEEEGRVVGREGGDDDDDYDDDDDDGINGKRRMTERLSSAIRGAAWKGWKNKGGKGVRDDYIDIDGADDRRSPSRSLVLLAPPPPHNPPRSSSSRPPPPPSSSCSPHPHRNLGALIFGDDAVSNNRAGAGEMMYTVRAAAAPPRSAVVSILYSAYRFPTRPLSQPSSTIVVVVIAPPSHFLTSLISFLVSCHFVFSLLHPNISYSRRHRLHRFDVGDIRLRVGVERVGLHQHNTRRRRDRALEGGMELVHVREADARLSGVRSPRVRVRAARPRRVRDDTRAIGVRLPRPAAAASASEDVDGDRRDEREEVRAAYAYSFFHLSAAPHFRRSWLSRRVEGGRRRSPSSRLRERRRRRRRASAIVAPTGREEEGGRGGARTGRARASRGEVRHPHRRTAEARHAHRQERVDVPHRAYRRRYGPGLRRGRHVLPGTEFHRPPEEVADARLPRQTAPLRRHDTGGMPLPPRRIPRAASRYVILPRRIKGDPLEYIIFCVHKIRGRGRDLGP